MDLPDGVTTVEILDENGRHLMTMSRELWEEGQAFHDLLYPVVQEHIKRTLERLAAKE